jgi:NADH:ubiquinone oxidoreductase subunit E
MPTVQEQAIEWIHQALHFDAAFTEEIVAIVHTIPLSLVGMPYCPACESVLCGACGHCHMLDIVPFSRPLCPNDNDDMGASCAAWYQR